MTATHVRLGKGYWGIGICVSIFFGGGWLMVSPFALGYQRYGDPWTTATTNDFWVGLSITLFSLVGIMLFAFSLLGMLQAAGFLRPSPRPGRAASGIASPYHDEYERTMAMLAVTLATELTGRREADNGKVHAAQPPVQASGDEGKS